MKTNLHVYTSTITDMIQVAETEDGKYPCLLQLTTCNCRRGMCRVHAYMVVSFSKRYFLVVHLLVNLVF